MSRDEDLGTYSLRAEVIAELNNAGAKPIGIDEGFDSERAEMMFSGSHCCALATNPPPVNACAVKGSRLDEERDRWTALMWCQWLCVCGTPLRDTSGRCLSTVYPR